MTTNILKNKLSVIDRKCEQAARTEIDKLYAEARYEAGKFRAPDFSQATKVWLALIDRKETEFNAEIQRVLSISEGFDIEISEIIEVVGKYFEEEHFINRFEGFIESVSRQASRYGVIIDPKEFGTDLAGAAFTAAVKNRLREARASVRSEVELQAPDKTKEIKGWGGKLLSWNESVELKPNFFGIGVNLNKHISRIFSRRRK